MKKLSKILYSLIPILLMVIPARSHTNPKHSGGQHAPAAHASKPRDTAMTCIHVNRISDINFRDQEYSIELSLTIHTNRNIDFEKLEVLNAKRGRFILLKRDTTDDGVTATLKASYVIGQMWNVYQYPFDGQKLKLHIYHPLYDSSRLIFLTDGHNPHKVTSDDLENGWKIFDTPTACSNKIIQREGLKNLSNLTVTIDIHRKHPLWLFLKLCIGMYVAFFVAYIAFFIDVKQVDPRFGLPVGALFAAIGNKYITESILPQSPDFTIIDWLHTFTFLAILFIIAFSAFSLKHRAKEEQHAYAYIQKRFDRRSSRSKWIDKKQYLLVLFFYLCVNIFSVIWAGSHPHDTRSAQSSEQVEHHDNFAHS